MRSISTQDLRGRPAVRLSRHHTRRGGGTRRGERWPDPRSGRALVEVMEPADLRDGHHRPARWRLHVSWSWTVVVERLMWPHRIVVGDVGAQEPAEMRLVPDEEVVEAL